MNRLTKFSKHFAQLPHLGQVRTMATPSKIVLSTIEAPEYWTKPDSASAQKASELLQTNHDTHHIFFNNSGFHASIHSTSWHLLTVKESYCASSSDNLCSGSNTKPNSERL
jgi:hypothetical protein